MGNDAADAVERVRRSVEYWTQLYAESEEDSSLYPIAQDPDLGQRYEFLLGE